MAGRPAFLNAILGHLFVRLDFRGKTGIFKKDGAFSKPFRPINI
jgi:hypothetical protein